MKRYLIDGNNVVCAWKGVIKPMQVHEDEFLRLVESLLKDDDTAVIVFDGPRRPGYRASAIDVRYSPGEKADAVLIRMIQGSSSPEQLVVVSNDRQVLQAAKSCRRMRASDFLAEAASAKKGNPKNEPEKPTGMSPEECRQWLKAFGIKES